MLNALMRPALVIAGLLLLVPIATIVEGILDGVDDPKYVGGGAVLGVVVILLAILFAVGPKRPGIAMSMLGASGVMGAAVAWIYDGLSQTLIWLSVLVMFALCLVAAVAKMDRIRDDAESYF